MTYYVHYKQYTRWEKSEAYASLDEARHLASFLANLSFINAVFVLDPINGRQQCIKWNGTRQEVAA